MKKILVIARTDLANDPRVYRQLLFLRKDYQVVAGGKTDPRVDGVEFIRLDFRKRSRARWIWPALKLLAGFNESYYWTEPYVSACLSALGGVHPDGIVANDIESLPVALRLRGEGKVIWDAHEYWPHQRTDSFKWRLFFKRYVRYLCRTYIARADAMMTVSEGFVRAYRKDYTCDPIVVTNAPEYTDLEPRPCGEVIRLVHHGRAKNTRYLEVMIEALKLLGKGFELHLYLVEATRGYTDWLRKQAEGMGNVHFHDPVPMRRLPATLNAYDVGVFSIPPVTESLRYALPNKIFEFVQGRLAVVVGPTEEMARFVREKGCGRVADDFSAAALADALRELDPESIMAFKRQSHAIARPMSAEGNREKLLDLVRRVLPS